MVKAGVIGASGYAGQEVVRLLLNHPEVEVVCITSESFRGKRLSELYPHFLGNFDKELSSFMLDEAKKAEILFVALPHGTSMKVVPELLKTGLKVIDLSGDFRLGNKALYEKWYGIKHEASDLLGKAIYGLPEINEDAIREANFVASPGCYPTAVILALAPLLKEGLIFEEDIIVDAKSGVSGAGRKLKEETQFCKVNESIKAYSVTGHKHIPEMEQELSKIAKEEVKISFTPHLAPMSRGILATCYADLKEDMTTDEALEVFKKFYKGKAFVEVLPEGVFPETKNVSGSNYCHIGLEIDERCGRVIVVSAIDNLVKGASGQAVQNMNLMCGFDETLGLKQVGLFP